MEGLCLPISNQLGGLSAPCPSLPSPNQVALGMSLNISHLIPQSREKTCIPNHPHGGTVIVPLDPREARWRSLNPALGEMNEKSLEQDRLGFDS